MCIRDRSWTIHEDSDPAIDRAQACLGWGLAQYAFSTYRDEADTSLRSLDLATACPDADSRQRVVGLATGTALCRDLINAPPNHMTPQGLEDAARDLAGRFGAAVEVTVGDTLTREFPGNSRVSVSPTCLLYTSPSPRDRTRSRMPSSA